MDYQPEQDELEGLLHSGDEAASDEEDRGQQEEGEPGSGGEDAAAAKQRKVSGLLLVMQGLCCCALLRCAGGATDCQLAGCGLQTRRPGAAGSKIARLLSWAWSQYPSSLQRLVLYGP